MVTREELKAHFPNISDDCLNLVDKLRVSPVTTTPASGNRSQGLASGTGKTLNRVPKQAKPSKYGAQRTEYNGYVYASKHEAQAAQDLDLMIKAGEIDFYLRQVPFALPGRITYRADFVTYQAVQMDDDPPTVLYRVIVVEAKGMWTPEAKLKIKLFKERYPNLNVRIV